MRQRTAVLVILLLISLFTLPAEAQKCSASTGNDAFAAGQYQLAFDTFQCTHDANPDDVDALLGLSKAALMLGEFSTATSAIGEAGDAAGMTDRELAEPQIERLTSELAQAPNSVPVLTQLAHWLWLRGRDDEALPLYDSILALEPDSVFALTFRGSSLAYLGQVADAEAAFAQAIALAPDSDDIYGVAALSYNDVGEPEKTIQYASQAIALAPDYAYRYIVRGDGYRQLLDYQSALTDYTQALALSPGEFDAYTGQALAYRHLGDSAAGLEAINHALGLNPDSTYALNIRGNLLLDTNDLAGAQADFARSVELDPDEEDGYDGLGSVAYYQGDLPAAIEYYQQALTIDPTTRNSLVGMALALNQTGDAGAGQAFFDYLTSAPNQFDLNATGEAQSVALNYLTTHWIAFNANAGGAISAIVASDPAAGLDPVIVLVDPNGQVIAFADDSANSLDPELSGVSAPATGVYTLLIGSLNDGIGEAQVTIRAK